MIFKHLKSVSLVIFMLFESSTFAYAANEAITAKQVVENFQNELIATMKEGNKLGYTGRYQKLKDPISISHDLTKIARIVVGKEWESLSSDQQNQLVDVFSQLSVASYAHNFKDFSGESFVFDSEEEMARGGVIIRSHLVIPNDKPVKFEYQLKDTDNNWRIINIIANGVSDLALKRSEYTSILEREGFNALLAKINEKIENYSKQ